MAELVDAHGSGPCTARCGSSSLLLGTKFQTPVATQSQPGFLVLRPGTSGGGSGRVGTSTGTPRTRPVLQLPVWFSIIRTRKQTFCRAIVCFTGSFQRILEALRHGLHGSPLLAPTPLWRGRPDERQEQGIHPCLSQI